MRAASTARFDRLPASARVAQTECVWRQLTPVHFAAAIALGVLEVFFLALTYAQVPALHGQRLIECLVLFAALAGCMAMVHLRRPAGAWVLLAIAYGFLVLFIAHTDEGREFIIGQIMAHCVVFAVALANGTYASRSSGRLAYGLAAVAGVAIGACIWGVVLWLGPDFFTDETWAAEAASPLFRVLHPVYVATFWLLFAGPGVVLYGEAHVAALALRRLRESELERSRRAHEMTEAELRAMQARVEPQFLFDTLAHIRASCRHDVGTAERMLDELVAFLRAAMPRMRDTSSVVDHEIALARAYLGLVGMHPGHRIDFAIEVADDAAHARLPSMLLLPLLDHVVAGASPAVASDLKLRIGVAIEEDRLAIRVVSARAARVDAHGEDTVGLLRARLQALYGDRATLGIAPLGAGLEAVLAIPLQGTDIA